MFLQQVQLDMSLHEIGNIVEIIVIFVKVKIYGS